MVFLEIEFAKLLRVYKYFSWADKKLHSVFYIENKDDISEDLLNDFKDPDNEAKFQKPKVLHKGASQKEEKVENVIVKKDSLISEYDYLFGKKKDDNKIIDVKSQQDFPSLGNETSSNSSSIKNPSANKNQPIKEEGWGDNPFEEKESNYSSVNKFSTVIG